MGLEFESGFTVEGFEPVGALYADAADVDAALELRRQAITEAIQMVFAANGCHRNADGFFVVTDEAMEAIRKGAIQRALRSTR
jgi:hypothetical protein